MTNCNHIFDDYGICFECGVKSKAKIMEEMTRRRIKAGKRGFKMNSDIFGEYAREGREAFDNGENLSACPYSAGSDEDMAWTSGFDLGGLENQHRNARK